MNYLKALRRVPLKLCNPETLAYRDRVLAAGGAISSASLDYIEKFVQDCKNALIWDKLLDVCPFAGANLSAALVKLVRPNGVADSLTNVNFLAGDYNETGANAGLLGNGTTKYLNTGFNIQSSLPDNAHLSFYLREDVATGGNCIPLGASNATDHYWLGALTPATQLNARLGQLATANGTGALNKAFYLASRTAPDFLRIYRNGAQIGSVLTSVTHTKPNLNIYAFAANQDGTPGAHLPARLSFYSIGQALTDAETLALHNAVRTLQLNLDRNIN